MSKSENRPARPKLGAVLRGEQPTQVKSPVVDAPEPSLDARSKRAELVQLNVAVSAELRKRVRLKALQHDRDVAAVVRELLERWVTED